MADNDVIPFAFSDSELWGMPTREERIAYMVTRLPDDLALQRAERALKQILKHRGLERLKDAGVYILRNKVNGIVYVGMTYDLKSRIPNHWRLLKKGRHHCPPLQEAYDQFGADAFVSEVIENANVFDLEDDLRLKQREYHWIMHYEELAGVYNVRKIKPVNYEAAA